MDVNALNTMSSIFVCRYFGLCFGYPNRHYKKHLWLFIQRSREISGYCGKRVWNGRTTCISVMTWGSYRSCKIWIGLSGSQSQSPSVSGECPEQRDPFAYIWLLWESRPHLDYIINVRWSMTVNQCQDRSCQNMTNRATLNVDISWTSMQFDCLFNRLFRLFLSNS